MLEFLVAQKQAKSDARCTTSLGIASHKSDNRWFFHKQGVPWTQEVHTQMVVDIGNNARHKRRIDFQRRRDHSVALMLVNNNTSAKCICP